MSQGFAINQPIDRLKWAVRTPGSGGGGTGNAAMGPDFGDPGKPIAGAVVAMPTIAVDAQSTAGVGAALTAMALAAEQTVGVTPQVAIGLSSILDRVGTAVALPSMGLAANDNVAVAPLMPTLGAAAAQSVASQFAGTINAAPFWQSVGIVNSAGSGTSIVIPAPSGTTVGNLLLAFVGAGQLQTFAPPSGWASIRDTQRTGTNNCSLSSYYRVATSADVTATDYTFTFGTSAAYFGSIHRINAQNASPIDISGDANGSAVSPVAPSVTTTLARALVFIACVQTSLTDISYTAPASWAERTDQNGLGLAGAHSIDGAVDTRVIAAAGASGAQTMTSSGVVASDYCAQTVAVMRGVLTIT